MHSNGLNESARALLVRAGASASALEIEPCAAGGNNRVYSVTADGRRFIAKRYFSNLSDPRDRIGAEYAFLEYAAGIGLGCVPRPLAIDREAGLALYEFVEGRRLEPRELAASHVEQAFEFFRVLNRAGNRKRAAGLPTASEACFSIDEQLALVEGRVARLAGIERHSELDAAAFEFSIRLASAWQALKAGVQAKAARRGMDATAPLAPEHRCVSPSDFGFHNALVRPSGKLVFIDFEYSGWDDPAKMVGDFFSQPAVPVPAAHFERFLAGAVEFSDGAEQLADRARLLLPVFRVKWCCIVLNAFLPELLARRKFADPGLDEAGRKRAQLGKAERLLSTIQI